MEVARRRVGGPVAVAADTALPPGRRIADASDPRVVEAVRRYARSRRSMGAQPPDELERAALYGLARGRITAPGFAGGDAALFAASVQRAIIDGYRAEYGRRPERQAITRAVVATDPEKLHGLSTTPAADGGAERCERLDSALSPADVRMLNRLGLARAAVLVAELDAADLGWLRVLHAVCPEILALFSVADVGALAAIARTGSATGDQAGSGRLMGLRSRLRTRLLADAHRR